MHKTKNKKNNNNKKNNHNKKKNNNKWKSKSNTWKWKKRIRAVTRTVSGCKVVQSRLNVHEIMRSLLTV